MQIIQSYMLLKLESVESQVGENKTNFGRYLTVMFEVILPAIIDSKVYIKVFKAFVPKNSFML